MKARGSRSGLRLARIAGDSVLKERILAGNKPNKDLVDVITVQLKCIIEEMEAEWENDPESNELREGFRLLADYVRCLAKYGSGSRSDGRNL